MMVKWLIEYIKQFKNRREMKPLNVQHIVLDIETASLTTNAAILTLAAVPFDPWEPSDRAFRDTMRRINRKGDNGLLPCFSQRVDLTSCFLKQMDIDPKTAEWWAKQSEEARRELLADEAQLISDVVINFCEYIDKVFKLSGKEEIRLWMQGLDFDMPIFKNALRKTGNMGHWHVGYKNCRCARTLVHDYVERTHPEWEHPYSGMEPLFPENDKAAVSHSALYDAKRTAWAIRWVYRDFVARG